LSDFACIFSDVLWLKNSVGRIFRPTEFFLTMKQFEISLACRGKNALSWRFMRHFGKLLLIYFAVTNLQRLPRSSEHMSFYSEENQIPALRHPNTKSYNFPQKNVIVDITI